MGQHPPQHQQRAEHCVSHARSSTSLHTVDLTAAGSDQRGAFVCRDEMKPHQCRSFIFEQSTVLLVT
jgi:hypothetical protein